MTDKEYGKVLKFYEDYYNISPVLKLYANIVLNLKFYYKVYKCD